MCKLTLAIKANNSQDKLIEKVIRAQETRISEEPHGISALIVRYDNKIEVKKELNDYQNVFQWVYDNIKKAKVISIHSRQATDGSISEENLHFNEIDKCFIAHNGIVGKYSGYGYLGEGSRFGVKNDNWNPVGKTISVFDGEAEKEFADEQTQIEGQEIAKEVNEELEDEEQDTSDSYKFLLNIPKPITKDVIRKEIAKTRFNGVATIIDSQAKKLFLFSTRDISAHTDFKNYLILYSFTPESVISTYQNVFGIKVSTEKAEIELNEFVIPEDVYEVGINDIKSVVNKLSKK